MNIGLTMGDCAGIGPEVILKALANIKLTEPVKFVIYGDRKVFEAINNKYHFYPLDNPALSFIDLGLIQKDVEFGTIKEEYGFAAGEYIKKAIEDALDKKIDAVVTAPIHKKSFELGGYGKKYAGHTEMFVDLTKTQNYTMMLAYRDLRVLHVTIHVPLKKAIEMITSDRVYQTIKIGYETCKKLGVPYIRIGVAGLNPHAGDQGLFGDEDIKEISPAITRAQKEFTDAVIEGPVPADTLFSKAFGGMYDMVIAMYHDQGHIPLKTLGFKYNHKTNDWIEIGGINVTLGLPIIRVSVDHGPAFGKAGKGIANPDSLIDAIEYAILFAKNNTRFSQ